MSKSKRKTSEIVIVANRLPVYRAKRRGKRRWETSPGGLVSALTPILQDRASCWVGWPGDTGSRISPFTHEGIEIVPVNLGRQEKDHYYDGFSNGTLWPLYHDAIRTPQYHREWWTSYVEVNRRFAEAAAERAAPGGLVWVHDYHLQLVPRMLRELRDDLKIGFFLHIPFPPQELFGQLPWRAKILEGLLGADVIGFQTKVGARNFTGLCRRYLGARPESNRVPFEGRSSLARAFPISVDVEAFESLASDDWVQSRSAAIRARLGGNRRILLGVDRLDYTKGIDIRLKAYGELLAGGHVSVDDHVLVQVAVPSREQVDDYLDQRSLVEQLIGGINGAHGELGRSAIHYLHRNLPVEELVALYRAADVMIVTPLRDGMNLVAKEYVSTRQDDDGVLVLSEFTGAAHELRSALQVNPHDVDGLQAVLREALAMKPREQRRRMKALRRVVSRHTIHDWASDFFEALSE